jgi:hypothetical protein
MHLIRLSTVVNGSQTKSDEEPLSLKYTGCSLPWLNVPIYHNSPLINGLTLILSTSDKPL